MTSPSGCDCIFYSSNVGSRLQTAIADAAWQDNHCLRISALSRSDDAKVMRMTPSLPDDVVAVSVAWTPRTHWSLPSEDTLSLLSMFLSTCSTTDTLCLYVVPCLSIKSHSNIRAEKCLISLSLVPAMLSCTVLCIVAAAPQVCSIAAAKAGAASTPFSRQLNQNCCLAVSTVRRPGW